MFEHDLLGKPVPTFPDHDLGRFAHGKYLELLIDRRRRTGAVQHLLLAEATTSLKRLSVSEAVMELDLSGAACIVFQHGGSGRVNIIYRRPDGNIGWIDPPLVKP